MKLVDEDSRDTIPYIVCGSVAVGSKFQFDLYDLPFKSYVTVSRNVFCYSLSVIPVPFLDVQRYSLEI